VLLRSSLNNFQEPSAQLSRILRQVKEPLLKHSLSYVKLVSYRMLNLAMAVLMHEYRGHQSC
jgi:hypothetical protein